MVKKQWLHGNFMTSSQSGKKWNKIGKNLPYNFEQKDIFKSVLIFW